ncbi:MAG TPA: sugar phosphate isomerase/epimerase family protein [Pyrinomonadaceae bacterium]
MKLAFSTLGCPNWELDRIGEAAHAFGYEAVELRAVGGDLDLLNRAEFTPWAVATTRQWFADQGLSVCCVDSSCTFDSLDEHERRHQVEIAIRHCELAAKLDSPLVRVFPDRIPPGATREQTRDNIASCLTEVGKNCPDSVRVALETHGDFARAEAAGEIVRLAANPNVALIWDVANALNAGDSIEESATGVSTHLAHVHLRDACSVSGQEHWRPVLSGRGNVSFEAAVNELQRMQYDGYVCFEWEKYWQPDIEDPEIALPDFANAMKKILAKDLSSVS